MPYLQAGGGGDMQQHRRLGRRLSKLVWESQAALGNGNELLGDGSTRAAHLCQVVRHHSFTNVHTVSSLQPLTMQICR